MSIYAGREVLTQQLICFCPSQGTGFCSIKYQHHKHQLWVFGDVTKYAFLFVHFTASHIKKESAYTCDHSPRGTCFRSSERLVTEHRCNDGDESVFISVIVVFDCQCNHSLLQELNTLRNLWCAVVLIISPLNIKNWCKKFYVNLQLNLYQ